MSIDERPRPRDDFPERVWLEVRILPDDIPRAIRMRRFLKAALRAYGIRAEGIDSHGTDRAYKRTWSKKDRR